MQGIAPGSVILRPMTPEDLPRVLALARAGGRNVSEQEYARFLGLEGARARVIERDGELLAAGTALRYYDSGFLGPVLLRDGADPPGLVIAVLAGLIEALQREGIQVIDAEAGRAEEEVFARMGFAFVRRTLILERAASPAPDSASAPMAEHHLLDVGSLDAEAVGHGRKDHIAALRREVPEGARVVERDGDVVGFVVVRAAARGHQLGPLVTRAEDADAARELLRGALRALEDAGPTIALAAEGSPGVALLEAEGFREVGSLSRMRAGAREATAEGAATQWALGGRMTG